MYIIYVFIITKSITAIFKAKFSLLDSAQGLTQGFYLAPVNSEFGKYSIYSHLPTPHLQKSQHHINCSLTSYTWTECTMNFYLGLQKY